MGAPVTIALDAMGGDHGPSVVIPAASLALIRHPEMRFVLVGDVARIDAWIEQPFEDDRRAIEYRVRRQDGSYCWVNDRQQMLRDGKGQPSEIVGSWTDITTRKEAEEANSAARERLSVLLGAARWLFRA